MEPRFEEIQGPHIEFQFWYELRVALTTEMLVRVPKTRIQGPNCVERILAPRGLQSHRVTRAVAFGVVILR